MGVRMGNDQGDVLDLNLCLGEGDMCVYRGYGGFPMPGGGLIASLKAGDEITIKAGHGYPTSEGDMTDIIVAVDGFSALTASGVRLMCSDGLGIEKTGNHFEEGEYEISPEAQVILAAVETTSEIEELLQ